VEDRRRPRKLDYADIDLSRWKDYEGISTESLWILKSRDSRGGHKLDYHGNFIPQIANQIMLRYTREDDIVVDWFLGSGTSAIEAENLNRRLIGVELKPELIEHVNSKLTVSTSRDRIRLIPGNSALAETRKAVESALTSTPKASSTRSGSSA